MDEDKVGTKTGADGAIMHSLHAGITGTITITLLKTSPVNRALSLLYNIQSASSALTGQNQLNVTDPVRGDLLVGTQMAFVKQPDLSWDKEGASVEWMFRGQIYEQLGDGNPVAA